MTKLFFEHFNYKIYTVKYTRQIGAIFGSTNVAKSPSEDLRMLFPASQNNFTKSGDKEKQETFCIGGKQG